MTSLLFPISINVRMHQQRTHLFQRAKKWLTEEHSVVTKLHFIICLLNFHVNYK